MRNYQRTTIAVSIHAPGVHPLFGESATHVMFADEAGGPFLVIKQVHDDIKPGEISCEIEELVEILAVAQGLMDGWPADE